MPPSYASFLFIHLYISCAFCSFATTFIGFQDCRQMKKKAISLMVYASLMLLSMGCSSTEASKDDNHVKVLVEDGKSLDAPQYMAASDTKSSFVFRGKGHMASIARRPDNTLPMVSNAEGDTFVDNNITLIIACENREVFNRTFVKEDFASQIDDRFMKHAILDGLVYDSCTSQAMFFVASICYPQSDLYVPVELSITSDGKVGMRKLDEMDSDMPEFAK